MKPWSVAKLEGTLSRVMGDAETLDCLENVGTGCEFFVGGAYRSRLPEERALFGEITSEAGIQPQ